MGYLHIDRLEKSTQVLEFKHVYALEKIHGCLRWDSQIRMANGAFKRIQEVQSGDEVISFNEETQSFVRGTVKSVVIQPPTTKLGWHRIGLENGKVLVVTEDHPFLTKNRGWVEAKYLTPDDNLVSII